MRSCTDRSAAAGRSRPGARFAAAGVGIVFCGLAGAWAVGTVPRTPTLVDPGPPPATVVETVPARIAELPSEWAADLEAALAAATVSYRPVLALFTSPNCGWCRRLKQEMTREQEVAALLKHFALAEIDVSLDPAAGLRYQIRGVPALLILSADGQVRGGFSGYAPPAEVRRVLQAALNPAFLRKQDAAYADLLQMLQNEEVPAGKWADIMIHLGDKEKRKEMAPWILRVSPPRKELVGLLADPRLAVRMGAIEILEEMAGDARGYDPWKDEENARANAEALARWQAWAGEPATTNAAPVYSPLSRDEVQTYVRDLVSDNRDRSLRALRMLQHGGPSAGAALTEFLAANPDLPPGAKMRLREARYAILIPPAAGMDPAAVAHRLVFGTLDVRLQNLQTLQAARKKALPVLKDILADPEGIVRETAIDVLTATCGRESVPVVAEHLKRETDENVVYSALRSLGRVRSKSGLKLLTSYLTHPNEDLAIVALDSIGRLRSSESQEDVVRCLRDERWRVRVAALGTAAKLRLTSQEAKIVALLSDKDPFVRHTAVKTLGEIGATSAAAELERIFLREDELKAPVVAALLALQKPLPKSFGPALRGKSADILLGVIEAVQSHRPDDVSLLVPLTDHENPDVSCSAIRACGTRAGDDAEVCARLRTALQSGARDKVLAVIESLPTGNERFRAFFGSAGASRTPVPSPDAAAAGGTSLISDLVDAFVGETPPSGAGVPSPPAAPPPTNRATSDDVFSAFTDTAEPPSPRAAQSWQQEAKTLLQAVEKCLDHSDAEIRFQSALCLCRLGRPRAIAALDETVGGRPSQDRTQVAHGLRSLGVPAVEPLLRKLLRDPVEQVRKTAVDAALENTVQKTAFVDVVFEELLRPGTALRPEEAYGYEIRRLAGSSAGKQTLRKWIETILQQRQEESLVNMAIMFLEPCWRSGDESLLEKYLSAESPFRRRAAWAVLGQQNRTLFEERITNVVADSSEYVRAVVPYAYGENAEWVHYLDANRFVRDEGWWRSYRRSRPAMTDAVRDVLLRLTQDPSLGVRVEAFLALLQNRAEVNLAQLVDTVEQLPDRQAVAGRLASYLMGNYRRLGPGFRVLLPYLEHAGRWTEEDELSKVWEHFGGETLEGPDAAALVSRAGAPQAVPATYLEVKEAPGSHAPSAPPTVMYFTSPGCRECARTEKFLDTLQESFPGLVVITNSIRTVAAMRLNEALCERFRVPERIRLVTPAIFAAGGCLIRDDVTFDRLGELLARSSLLPGKDWYAMPAADLTRAEASIRNRYEALGFWVVAVAGALDGINPCAFATIIFFLSYLQITRRTPRQIVQVGMAFILGVFLAYFALGLGLAELVTKLKVLERFSRIVNGVIAVFTLVIMVLSVRDGILCVQGRLKDTALQLPAFLKSRIHEVIRAGARQTRFVVAAFVTGMVISLLELACTGQVYAPTILFMLNIGKGTAGPIAYLALYNVAFVVPLIVIFVLAYGGMTSQALTRFLERRAAVVKFGTAFLFLALFLVFVFRERLPLQQWIENTLR